MSHSPEPSSLSLADFVRDRDVNCPLCSTSLRDACEPRCPHCHEPLVLSLTVADPKVAAWLLLALPLLFTAGIGSLMFLSIVVNTFRPSGARPPSGKTALVFAAFILTVPLSIAAVLLRRRFNRLSRTRRRILGFASLTYVVVVFICALMT